MVELACSSVPFFELLRIVESLDEKLLLGFGIPPLPEFLFVITSQLAVSLSSCLAVSCSLTLCQYRPTFQTTHTHAWKKPNTPCAMVSLDHPIDGQ
jgi:hypothetical protein